MYTRFTRVLRTANAISSTHVTRHCTQKKIIFSIGKPLSEDVRTLHEAAHIDFEAKERQTHRANNTEGRNLHQSGLNNNDHINTQDTRHSERERRLQDGRGRTRNIARETQTIFA